jgi:hypothetical protein
VGFWWSCTAHSKARSEVKKVFLRRVVGMKQRLLVYCDWFALVDRVDYLIRRAIIAYWLAPARHRWVAPSSPKPLSPALLLRPLL